MTVGPALCVLRTNFCHPGRLRFELFFLASTVVGYMLMHGDRKITLVPVCEIYKKMAVIVRRGWRATLVKQLLNRHTRMYVAPHVSPLCLHPMHGSRNLVV